MAMLRLRRTLAHERAARQRHVRRPGQAPDPVLRRLPMTGTDSSRGTAGEQGEAGKTQSEPLGEPAPVPARVARARRTAEPEVLGGRMLTAIAMLGAIGLVSWQWLHGVVDRTLHPKEPKPAATWQVGTEADIELTLITADARRLSCAHDNVVE